MNQPSNPLHNPEAERSVLGACLLSPENNSLVVQMLNPEDFYDNKYRVIFEAIRELLMQGKPIDYITIAEALRSKDYLDRIGGISAIVDIAAAVSSTANVSQHVQIVRELAIRRKLIDAGEVITKLSSKLDTSISSILEHVEKILYNFAQSDNTYGFIPIKDLLENVTQDIAERAKDSSSTATIGSTTGFADLDALTGGLQSGSLNIIAARPSMGKTALALNIAQFGAARSLRPVLVFSLEMPAEHLAMRMIAAESSVSLSSIMRGTLTAQDFQDIKAACNTLAQLNIYVNDATSLSALDFRAKCREFFMKQPDIALVIVDYLQLMTSGEDRLIPNRNLEISDISRTLKSVAREMKCPVIALSQLSRDTEKRPDKKPQLSDLRDSGAIEQDADLVMMLYRQDYYSENENNDLRDSEADLRIAKNRNGSTGVIKLIFRREITRFFNRGDDHPPQA